MVLEPTETTDGMRSRICLDCGRCDEESIKATNPGHTHSFGEWLNDAEGHWKQCECGEKNGAAAYKEGSWIVDVPATETADGLKHIECTVCHYVMEKQSIPATGHGHIHSYENIKSNADSHWKECECGVKDKVESHGFVWIIDKPATTGEAGIKHEECSVCGYKRGENTKIPIHSEGETIKIPVKAEERNPNTGAPAPKMSMLIAMAAVLSTVLVLKKRK